MADQSALTSYISAAYVSPIAAGLMDLAASTGVIRIGTSGSFEPGSYSGYYDVAGAYLGFNVTAIGQSHYFNATGTFVKEVPAITVAHEFIHFVLKGEYADTPHSEVEMNGANYDFDQNIIREQNKIAGELGQLDRLQVSYHSSLLSVDARFSKLTVGQSYTDGKAVDVVRLGDHITTASDNIDNSLRNEKLRDLVFGFDGDDTIKSGKGDDYAYGGNGNDTVQGGEGNDILHGDGKEVAHGETGNDTLVGNAGDDVLSGGPGNDFLWGDAIEASTAEAGDDVLKGGPGDDYLNGGVGKDFIEGGDGDDEIHLYDGDVAIGGPGADKFYIYTDRISPDGTPPQDWAQISNLILDMDANDRLYVDGVLYTGRVETAQLVNPYFEYEINATVYELDIDVESAFGESGSRSSEIRFSANADYSGDPGVDSNLRLTDVAMLTFYPGSTTSLSLVLADYQGGDGGMNFQLAYEYNWLESFGDYSQEVRYTDGLDFAPDRHNSDGGAHWNWGYTTEPTAYGSYPFDTLDDVWLDRVPQDVPLRDYYNALLVNNGAAGVSGTAGNDVVQASPGLANAFGFDGDDMIYGAAGFQMLFGGNGDDQFWYSAGNDVVDGGSGIDTLHLPGMSDAYFGTETESGSVIIERLDGSDDSIEAQNLEMVHFAGDNRTISIGDFLTEEIGDGQQAYRGSEAFWALAPSLSPYWESIMVRPDIP